MDHYSYSMSQRASKTLIYIKLFLQFTRYFVIVIGLSLVGPNLLVHLRGFPLFQCRQEQYLHSVFIQLLFIWLSLLQSSFDHRFKKIFPNPENLITLFRIHSFIWRLHSILKHFLRFLDCGGTLRNTLTPPQSSSYK